MAKSSDNKPYGDHFKYHPRFAEITGSVTAALLLSHLVHWSGHTSDPHKWLYKTQGDLVRETGLTRTQQDYARDLLRRLGLVMERRAGVKGKLHFQVQTGRLGELLKADCGNSTMQETCNQECGKPTDRSAGNLQSLHDAPRRTPRHAEEGVPSTVGAAYSPPSPSQLELAEHTPSATPPPATQRPAAAAVTDEFGEAPPAKGRTHSAECVIPGAEQTQTRPVGAGAAEDLGRNYRQERLTAIQDLRPLEQALGRYYGNPPMNTLLEEWLTFLTTQRGYGRTFTGADAETAVQRQRDLLAKAGQKPKRRYADEITPHLVDIAEERERAVQVAGSAARPGPALPNVAAELARCQETDKIIDATYRLKADSYGTDDWDRLPFMERKFTLVWMQRNPEYRSRLNGPAN